MDELDRKTEEEYLFAQKNNIIAVLENVRSAYNVGSVLRTADAFLLQAVYTTGYTPHTPHKQIIKTSLGAEKTVMQKHFEDAAQAIIFLKENGYRIYAIEQTLGSIALQQFTFNKNEKIAVIFGNEVTGVEQSTIQLCDGCLEIPQYGMKHSLNISVAAGIVLWHLVKTQI